MNKKDFLKLIDKYLEGRASLQEEQLLLNFYESFREQDEWDEKVFGVKEDLANKMLSRIHASIKPATQKDQVNIPLWKRLGVAAAILLICSTTFYFYRQNNQEQTLATTSISPILPGSNKALLTLANGKKITLNDQANIVLANQGNTNIRVADGKLIYTPSTSHSANAGEFNLIEVPKGGQYQISLPDGSKVWLNAESSLYYPSEFNANERKVILTGEAYFEVSKDISRPFLVESKLQQIEVLGTHFNVSAYPDDDDTKTTLLEGSVRVSVNRKNEVRTLKPGQQTILTKVSNSSLSLSLKNVDIDEAVAWKNGQFNFQKENIRNIMKKIERWYNVEVIFNGPISDDLFIGTISRSKSLSSVLDKLELAGEVHFKIEERRVIVLP